MNARILIIEDDEAIRQAIRFKLEKSGHTVIQASDGRVGFDALKTQGPFQLLLLDLRMPDHDGITLLAEKARDEQIKNIPTIIITNLTDREMGQKALQYNIQGYLIKAHHSIEDIVQSIEKVLQGSVCEMEV